MINAKLYSPDFECSQDSYQISFDAVFDGHRLRQNQAVTVQKGTITAISPLFDNKKTSGQTNVIARSKGTLSPGFFDIQVNGGGGVLLNTTPTAEGAINIANAHSKLGTRAIFPTVITDSDVIIRHAAEAVIEAIEYPNIAGIHIEGPHINSARKGTHDIKHIRAFGAETLATLRRLTDHHIPTLITLAPEIVPGTVIKDICEMGVVVAIGHTAASQNVANQALKDGAQLFTHLFNAMPPMLSRVPGVVCAAINSNAYCSFIADGHHVSTDMLKLAVRARPVDDRMIIVSDAMPTIGGPKSFVLNGETILESGGKLINSEGSLAGAHTTMLDSVVFVINQMDLQVEQALQMAISNPAKLMGLNDQFSIIGASIKECIHIY